MIHTTISDYYRERAQEYEDVYYRDDPVRQKEQRIIAQELQKALKGKSVLEIACGTGYWTHPLSETAKSIIATDIVLEVLDIAKTKQYDCPVAFAIADAYQLSFTDNSFTGGLANFWLSHVPKEKLTSFLQEFHRVLKRGSSVFFVDNVFVPGIGGKLMRKKQNTYKLRSLKDNSERLVLKNYYDRQELHEIFTPYSDNVIIFIGKCFWYVTYTVK